MNYGEINTKNINTSTRVVILANNNQLVGFVTWDQNQKTLQLVRVACPFRRKGYGTFLVKLADQYAKTTLTDTGYRSPEGTKLLRNMKRPLAKYKGTVQNPGQAMEAILTQLLHNQQIQYI